MIWKSSIDVKCFVDLEFFQTAFFKLTFGRRKSIETCDFYVTVGKGSKMQP